MSGGNAVSAGDAVAIENKPRLPGREMAKGLFQYRRMLPMDGEIAVFQQSRRCKHISATGNAPDPDTLPRQPPQRPVRIFRNGPVLRPAARTDENRVAFLAGSGKRLTVDNDAGRTSDGLAIKRQGNRIVQIGSSDQIGGAQRLRRRGIGHERKVRNEDETNALDILLFDDRHVFFKS